MSAGTADHDGRPTDGCPRRIRAARPTSWRWQGTVMVPVTVWAGYGAGPRSPTLAGCRRREPTGCRRRPRATPSGVRCRGSRSPPGGAAGRRSRSPGAPGRRRPTRPQGGGRCRGGRGRRAGRAARPVAALRAPRRTGAATDRDAVGAQWLRHLRPDRFDHAGGPRRCGPRRGDGRAVEDQRGAAVVRLFAAVAAPRRRRRPQARPVGRRGDDILFALNSVGVSPLLTTSRGWTPARWERWLVTTLVASLLR